MAGPFEQDGVPEDLKHMLAGGRPLGGPVQIVDPRQLPLTYEETRFRGCTHVWELVPHPEDPTRFAIFQLIIRDVNRGKVYIYGLPLEAAEQTILKLQELIKLRDANAEETQESADA